MEANNYSYAMSVAFDNVVVNALMGVGQTTNIRQSRVTLTLKTDYSGPYSRNWIYMSAWARANYTNNQAYKPLPFKPDMLTAVSMLIEGPQSHWFVLEDLRKYRSWAAVQQAIVVMSGNIYGGTLHINKFREPYEMWTQRYYNNFMELEAVHLIPCVPGRVMGIALDAGLATIDIEYDFDKIIGNFRNTPLIPVGSVDEVCSDYMSMSITTQTERMAKKVFEMPMLEKEKPENCDTGPRFILRDDVITTIWNTPVKVLVSDLLANDIIEGVPEIVEILDIKGGYLTNVKRNATLTPDGSFIFVPTVAVGENGSFKYRVTNSEGRQSINTAFVTVVVWPPVLIPKDDEFDILEREVKKISWTDLTKNDRHQNPIKSVQIIDTYNVTVTNANNTITITPDVPAYNTGWFSYKLVDASGFISQTEAIVRINIQKPKLEPHNDTFHVKFHGTAVIPVSVLTSNDESDFPIASIEITRCVGGKIDFLQQNIHFTHTGEKDVAAFFSYKIIDELGYESMTSALVTAIVEPPKLTPVADKNFNILQGTSINILWQNLFANDIHDNPIARGIIVEKVGCEIKDENGTLTVRPTVAAGETCFFSYKIADTEGFTSDLAARVTLTVYQPVLIPQDDKFSVVQRGTLTIPLTDLYKNDIHENAISQSLILDTMRCAVTVSGTSLIVKPSAIYGESCWFTYKLIDSTGYESPEYATVTVNITMLPNASANIYTTAQLQQMLTSGYKPPTLKEIFDSWARYYAGNYYGPNTTPKGEAASWQMHTAKNFRCTVNSSNLTGFVSPEKFDSYIHQADFSSTDSDDDAIYLIIAFKRVGGNNHSLMAMRCATGNWVSPKPSNCFAIVYTMNGTSYLIKQASGTKCRQTGGWNKNSPTRVRVTRRGDKIIAESSPAKSTNLAAGEKIEIDLKNYSNLAWAREKLPYGYACWSQRYSSFDNVEFDADAKVDMEVLYDGETGDVWRYKNNVWTKTDEKVWEIFDAPRYIDNPLTGEHFMTGQNTVGKV